ncbi:cation:proton antiporter [Candidatus Micrarchaeota archaeon]|nr:cation:proton antiporter [Candidatus Micrarchaeota archaeon]
MLEAMAEIPVILIGVIVLVALFFGLIFSRLKLSSSIGFILAGIVLGPLALNYLTPGQGVVTLFEELGLMMLLFYLGLELSIEKFKQNGAVAFVLVGVEILVSFAIGYGIARFFGYSGLEALVIGLLMPMASTVIAVKFILEKGLIQTFEARIAISSLIIEDFLAIIILVFLSTLSTQKSVNLLVFNALVFVIAAFFVVSKLSKVVLKTLHSIGQADKMALYAIGIGILVSYLSNLLGLSPVLGAYFAGFALAETAYAERIKRELGFFRDFFILFFFVSFGAKVALPSTPMILVILAVMLVCYVISKIFVYGTLGTALGMNQLSAVTTGLIMMSIGEFSIIIAAASASLLPHAGDVLGLAFLLVISTTILSPALFNRKEKITELFARLQPKSVNQALSTLAFEAGTLESALLNKSFQNAYWNSLKRLITNLLVVFSVVYISYLTKLQVDIPFAPWVGSVSIGLLLLPLLIWPLYKALREFAFLVRAVVSSVISTAFPQAGHKQFEIAKLAADLFTSVILVAVGAIVFFFTLTRFDPIFLVIPAVYTLLALVFLGRTVYSLFEHYESLQTFLGEAAGGAKPATKGVKQLALEFDVRSQAFRELHRERLRVQQEIEESLDEGDVAGARHALAEFKKREQNALAGLLKHREAGRTAERGGVKPALLHYFKKNPPEFSQPPHRESKRGKLVKRVKRIVGRHKR